MTLSKNWARDNISDDVAFKDYADPNFPWIRVVFGKRPELPPNTEWVYVLRANGNSTKMQARRVAWYVEGLNTWPSRQRPIAYAIVDADFNPVEHA